MVLAGPGAVILLSLVSFSGLVTLSLIALVFGGTVALMILVFGKHSGSVINPAVTLAVACARLLKRELILPYLLFQIVGGILAGITLRFLFLSTINSNVDLGSTKLAAGISPLLGITFEGVGTFVLASSALLASTKIKRIELQALCVGSTLSILIIFIGPLTGAGFNPARSLGPSLASGYFENLYVYLLGPSVGAMCAGLLFRVIRDNGGKKLLPICVC